MQLNQVKLTQFQSIVRAFYKKNKRAMPWRETQDPYSILISEVMLQQTQVSRVLVKFPLFIKRFPNWKRLAQASTIDILSIWSGMGYNRRALYLKKISEIVVKEYNSILPENLDILDSLPGIGPATAASIAAFAFNKPVVFIETNIRRVFIHHFFKDKREVDDKQIYPLVEATLDIKNPREWYYALMDYGAHLAKNVPNPNKRSKHYAVQPGFEGSDRQLRGLILKTLLTGSLSQSSLIKSIGKDKGKVIMIINQLVKEGFIVEVRKKYQIK